MVCISLLAKKWHWKSHHCHISSSPEAKEQTLGVEQGTSTPGGGQCIFKLLQEGGVAEMCLTCVQSDLNELKLSASIE